MQMVFHRSKTQIAKVLAISTNSVPGRSGCSSVPVERLMQFLWLPRSAVEQQTYFSHNGLFFYHGEKAAP
jgi:hypothetical protein